MIEEVERRENSSLRILNPQLIQPVTIAATIALQHQESRSQRPMKPDSHFFWMIGSYPLSHCLCWSASELAVTVKLMGFNGQCSCSAYFTDQHETSGSTLFEVMGGIIIHNCGWALRNSVC